MEADVVHRFEDNPSTTTRAVAPQKDVSHKNMGRVLHDKKMHPFQAQKVEQLSVTNYGRFRMQFA